MDEADRYELRPVGRVESRLVDLSQAPKQADEGAPPAWVVFDPRVAEAMHGLAVGDEIVLLTWLHAASRDTLSVHPRGDPSRPRVGVFSTRSPDRPNPIGLHRVRVLAVEPPRVRVSALEAVDGTPILDVKPVLAPVARR